MREPLLSPLAALAAGILVSRELGFEIRELTPALAVFLVCLLTAAWRGSRRLAFTCLLLCTLCLGGLVQIWHRPGPPPTLDVHGRETVILDGCVVEPSALSEDRAQFTVELAPAARARVSVYPRQGESLPALRYGQRVEFDARVRSPVNFRNPGSFDYVGYQARRDIYWTASVPSSGAIRVLPGECGSRWKAAIYGIRGVALNRLENLYGGDAYGTGMMEALLIGETSKLQKTWTEQFRRTGTYHALVISGTHVAALAAVLLFVFRICGAPQLVGLTVTAAVAWLYALVCGWQAPVVRSAAGFTLFLIAAFFFRRARVLNLLAAVAIGFLLFDPEQMFEASFQLSFLAVAAIGAVAAPILQATSAPLAAGLKGLHEVDKDMYLAPRVAQFRVEMRMVAEILVLAVRLPMRWSSRLIAWPARAVFFGYELFVVSAVVQVGLALPMALYFHRLSISGLSANILVVPLTSVAVPVGFLAIFTGWSWPAWLARGLIGISQRVVEAHASWEPNWRVPDPKLWLSIFLAVALLLYCFSTRFAIARTICAAAVLAALALVIWHPFAPQATPGTLELTMIDVGQGDSLFVALPDGKLMVVDGGGISGFGRAKPRLDIGEDVVSPYLLSRSIRHVDVLVNTHQHEDHMGGLAAMMENFHPRELWAGATPGSAAWTDLTARARRLGVTVIPMRRGRRWQFGGAGFETLAPPEDYLPSTTPKNNDSLALRVTFGRRSMLLTGDVERPIENRLLQDGIERVDVLKIAHHGSKTSTSDAFLDAVHPAFALISAGTGNSFGHPHHDVLQRLADRHIAVFRTDEWGLVTIRTDGKRFEVETQRWSPHSHGRYDAF